MRALIALIFWTICLVVPSKDIAPVVVIPPMPELAPDVLANELEVMEWEDYWWDAFEDYQTEFDALFNAIEFKRAKNGASMIRRPGDKSFRFVKKG